MNVYIVIQSSGRPVAVFMYECLAIEYAQQMIAKGPQAEVVECELSRGAQTYGAVPEAKTVRVPKC